VLWLALDRQGGCLFNPKDNSCTLFSDIPALRLSKSTRSITYIKSLDEYWLVDYSTQIERVKKKNGKITYAGSVFLGTNEEGDKSIGEDAFGNVFIATEHELLMRKENGQISTVANFPSSILDFTFDKFGKTWVVTEKDGIYLFQRAKNGNYTPSVRYGKNTEVLATDDIRTVCAAADGLMWIGTREGRIITKQPQSENFIDLTTLCAMNGEYILDILEDKMGQIWISSYNKIIKYNPTTKTATIYTESDGINTNSFLENASFSSPSGKMFFGGDKGLCEFEPVAINKQKNVGKVLITDVKVNNQPAKITEKGLKISYSDKNIEIYFSSLDYTSVSRIQYAYKLEGVDKEWIYVNNRNYATYNNLKTGEYIFQVKATNPNGVWDETVTTFTIVKAPAFYETWWMILLYIVVLMVIIYFSYRYVSDRIRLQNSLKIAEIEKQSAEQLIQTKLRYFTNISHEFLTPLTIINCVVEDIPASFGDAAGVKSIIKANVSRLQRLLQQILDFRKVESGNMKLKIAQGDIVDFVQDICYQNFMPLIKEKNINFEFKIIIDGKEIIGDYSKSPNRHSEWTMIYFDADKIDKILFNLLSNAFKYTPQKGKISVIVEVLEQTIRISVTDTGKGIPATELPNIFNRFYNNKMANFGKSNGIGLSLTKELVELHHGHISVTSVLRQGATFVFEIPSKETAYIAEDFVVQINNKSVAGVVTSEPENEPEDAEDIGTPSTLEDLDDLDGLLIVEDNKELRDLLEKKFSQHYHTYIAENGQQALEIIKNEIINIVVSDVMMPQMDGLELCKRIKNDLSTSHIEVILLTAKNTEDDRIASYEAGADAYIAKPFEMKVLEARISNMVKKRQQRLTNFQTNPEVRISDMQYQSLDSDFLQKTIKIIEEHLDNSDFNIGQYAETLHMSRVTFYRKIKSLTGLSAVEFVRNVRLKHACEMLKNNSGNISEIAYAVGFQDPRYFSTIFKKEFGISPKQYK
jgi:signal transduction histidine kinase/DNA-binding response OmpR family regulator